MRTHQSVLCIFACLFFITSCQKKFENPDVTASSADTFRVLINGTSFLTNGISISKTLNDITLIASEVQTLKKVSLTLPSDIIPGSYPLDFFGMTYFGIYYPDASTTLISDNGVVTIIQNNVTSKRITGIFDFSARFINGGATFAQLTDGYFSVTYQ